MERIGVNLFDIGEPINKPIQLGEYKKCKHIWKKTIERYGEIKYCKCKNCNAIRLWK